jgi:hypothetical protein
MTSPRASELISGELKIVADDGPSTLRLDWWGRSHERNPGPVLSPWLEGVLQRARAQGLTIESHFEALDFFNSATVTALIQLIRKARAQGTTLVIVFSDAKRWQALSFDALKCFELPDGLLQIRAAGAVA